MNCSLYILGADGDRQLHAYPDDYATHEVFQKFVPYLKNNTLLAIHRNGSLAYHLWLHATADGFFGFCILTNGLWLSRTDRILALCNNAYTLAVTGGSLLRVDSQGLLHANATIFAQHANDIGTLYAFIKEQVDKDSSFFSLLPPQDATTSPTAIKMLPDEAPPHQIARELRNYRSVVALYGEGGGNVNALLKHMQDIAHERDQLASQCHHLEEQCRTIQRQKNRYAAVVILAIALLVGSGGAIATISNKNTHIRNQLATIHDNEATIANQGNTISEQSQTIDEQSQSISTLQSRVATLAGERDALHGKVASLTTDRRSILTHKPFIVTNTEFDWSQGTLTVYYHATTDGTRSIRCRVISESDSSVVYDYTYTLSTSISKGDGCRTLNSLVGLSGSQWYRFEIYADNKFCGGGRH